MSSVKTIGERISIKSSPDKTTLVISSKIESWKEGLLAAWIVCWLISMGVFTWQLFQTNGDKEKIILFVVLMFMFYYAIRIIKVFAWRKWGMEYLRFTDDEVTYKRAIKKYGKAHVFYYENIKDVAIITKEDGSIAKVLENSFWVMGGERVTFEYLGKFVKIGVQLNDEDGEAFGKYFNEQIKRRKKRRKNQDPILNTED